MTSRFHEHSGVLACFPTQYVAKVQSSGYLKVLVGKWTFHQRGFFSSDWWGLSGVVVYGLRDTPLYQQIFNDPDLDNPQVT